MSPTRRKADNAVAKPESPVLGSDGQRGFEMITTGTNHLRQSGLDQLSPSLAQLPLAFLRLAIGIVITIVTVYLAGFALLIGIVETTGCFFSCSEPNLLIGIPMLIAAAGLATLGLGALWWGLVDRHCGKVFRGLRIFGLAVAAILVLGTVLP